MNILVHVISLNHLLQIVLFDLSIVMIESNLILGMKYTDDDLQRKKEYLAGKKKMFYMV